jgi:hypothetical protein
VHLCVELGFEHGRLADLVQLLAKSHALITDLTPDRSLYHVGMPEGSVEVTLLLTSLEQKKLMLQELAVQGFVVREWNGAP